MRKSRGRRQIQLSANPLDLDDPFGEEEDPFVEGKPMGGEEEPMGGEEQPPMPVAEEEMPYEDEELESGMYRAQVRRGKAVSGPRTKLAAVRAGRIERAVVQLADNQASMARSLAGLTKAVIGKTDHEGKKVGKGETESSFQPYGDGVDDGTPESEDPEETTMNEPGLQDPKGSKELKARRVAKDDASTNYGEKDSDIAGNREAGIDDKDKPAEEYLIQGGPGDGPGPVSKALKTELDNAYESVLAKHGIVKKAVGPVTGNSAVETGTSGGEPGMGDLFDQARGMSFADLNRIRTASGELSASIV